MERFSWRAKLIMLFVMILSVQVVIQLFAVVPYLRNQKIEATKIHQEEIAQNIARELNIGLDRMKNRILRMSSLPEFREMNSNAMQRLITQHQELSMGILTVAVLDSEGWLVCGSMKHLDMVTTQNYSDIPCFSVPFNEGTIYFSAPSYCAYEHVIYSYICLPVRSESGDIIGVIIGSVNLEDTIQRVEDYPLASGQILFIIDDAGTVIAHSRTDLFFHHDEPLSLNYYHRPMVHDILDGEISGSREHKHGTADYFGSFSVLECNGWGVIVEASMESILAGSGNMTRTVLFVNMLVFVVALILTVVFSGQITAAQRKVDKALRESEEKFRELADLLPEVVFECDTQGNLTFFNRIAFKKFGYVRKDFEKNVNMMQFIAEGDRKKAEESFKRLLSGVEKYQNEYSAMRSNGSTFPVIVYLSPIIREGIPVGCRGIILDITERKQAEEVLLRVQKLESVGTLAGGIAHDFNNILMGLFGNISMVREELSKDHPGFRFLEEAEKSMNRAIHLSKQLLTFAKGGAPVKECLSIGKLVEEVVLFDLSGSNVMPVFEQVEDLWMVDVDKGQMQQVFSNLTINANQAMPDGGHLYITLENVDISDDTIPNLSKGKYIKITGRDEGTGIDKRHLGRIFDPYFSTKQAGRGLGLATTYSIINKHGGHIRIDSKLGEGAIFTLYLPASESQICPESKHPVKVEHSKTRQTTKVLVMDDEEVICRLLTEMLKKMGHSVKTASSGEVAIEKYEQSFAAGHPFDVVIMDLTIPGGVGGKEAIKSILEIDPNARVIVSSGYADDPVMANYADYGFKGIATKPYTMDQLREVLNRILDDQ